MWGVSVDFLSLVERGRTSPSFKRLEIIAHRLGKPVAYLFSFETPSSSNQKSKGRKSITRSAHPR